MIDCICNIQLDMDEGCDVNMEMDDGDEYNLNVSGVKSVNGKVGKVVLDAGDFAYDDTKEYSAGSVGAELKELSQKEIDVDSALSDTSTNPVQNKVIAQEVTNLNDNLNDKADVIISSASGSIAHFEDGAEADAVSVIAHIEPVQAGSGDPSPDNVRPISGFTGMDVVRTGKNLFDKADASITSSNAVWGGTAQTFTGFLLKAGTYTLSCSHNVTGFYVSTKDGGNFHVAFNRASTTFTNQKTQAVRINFYIDGVTQTDMQSFDYQLELGSTVTDYEPYQGETYPVTFPTEAGTVYGGYVDVAKGELVINWYGIVVHPSQITAIADIGNNVRCGIYDITWSDPNAPNSIGARAKAISNLLHTVNGGYAVDETGFYFYSASKVYIKLPKSALTSADLDGVREYLTQNPMQIVYPLATPITYQLTPQQITTLLGTNNIWNDCNGNTDVEYKADTKLYIEQLTKPTEDDMTANANIASGKFFMVGNRLFLSTSAIASGDTINPGTNCTELSLADALNNLN